jgi:hypothetical protein
MRAGETFKGSSRWRTECWSALSSPDPYWTTSSTKAQTENMALLYSKLWTQVHQAWSNVSRYQWSAKPDGEIDIQSRLQNQYFNKLSLVLAFYTKVASLMTICSLVAISSLSRIWHPWQRAVYGNKTTTLHPWSLWIGRMERILGCYGEVSMRAALPPNMCRYWFAACYLHWLAIAVLCLESFSSFCSLVVFSNWQYLTRSACPWQ